MAACNIQGINRPRFIIHVTGEYLNRLSRTHNALPSSSTTPTVQIQWNKFHKYALEVVQDVNSCIESSDQTPLNLSNVLVRIFCLISAEVGNTLHTTIWSLSPRMEKKNEANIFDSCILMELLGGLT